MEICIHVYQTSKASMVLTRNFSGAIQEGVPNEYKGMCSIYILCFTYSIFFKFYLNFTIDL